jgi:hypothetical protein
MKLNELSSAEFYEDPYSMCRRIRSEGCLVPLVPKTFVTGHYDIVDVHLLDPKMGRGYLDIIRVRCGEEAVLSGRFSRCRGCSR